MSIETNLITTDYVTMFIADVSVLAQLDCGDESSSESSDQEEGFIAKRLIPAASAAIRRYTGRDFTPTSYTEYFDLNQWSDCLILRHYPVTAVSKVTLYPYDRTAIEEIDGDEYIVSRTGEIRLRPDSTASSLFPPGFQSVKVEYAAGGEVPADVKWACGRLVSAMLSAIGREPGLLIEKIEGYVRDFTDAALTTISANPELQAVLDPLRNGRVA